MIFSKKDKNRFTVILGRHSNIKMKFKALIPFVPLNKTQVKSFKNIIKK